MTPDELEDTRRHAARMSDQELGELYVKGLGNWPPEAWQILEEEVARRERAQRIANLTPATTRSSGQASSTSTASAGGTEKSNAVAGCLGLLLGPVGLWYKGQWAAGFAWLTMALILGIASGGLLAPVCWIGMAIHAAVAKVKE